MPEPLQTLIHQLGETISAHLAAANDRAANAELELANWRNGLRALLERQPNDVLPDPANDTALAETITESALSEAPTDARDNRTPKVADQHFLDVLTPSWQSANAIRKVMIASGHHVAFGTVYSRVEKLAEKFPEMIEVATQPVRWRLISPMATPANQHAGKGKIGACGAGKVRFSASVPIRSKLANGIPPDAITSVRDRIADAAAPQQVFTPDLRHGDCFELMKTIPDGSVDLILADPPYALTGLKIDPKIDVAALWKEYRRIIKPTGTIVLFGSQPFSSRLIHEAADLFKHDLVWIKNRATQALQARNRPMKQHEDILVFSAGTAIQPCRTLRRYTYNALGQVSAGKKKVPAKKHSSYLRNIKHNPGCEYEGTTNNPRTAIYCAKDEKGCHPFQKPLDLLEYLIRSYSNEGELVLDTFVGSGSTCVAAMRAGRRSIGIEMEQKYHAVAINRVAGEQARLKKPAEGKPEVNVIEANDNTRPPTVFASLRNATIYQGDCLEVMRAMPSESIDLVVTSPPYNIGRTVNGNRRSVKHGKWKGPLMTEGYASYDDARDPTDYIAWQKDVLGECWRLLRNDGAIYFNHKPRPQNGVLRTPLDLNPGLPVRQIVIWDRKAGMNFNASHYRPSHEWIVIFAKPDFRLRSQGASGIGDVWTVPHERNNDHPAPFPVELPQRAIESTSAQVILDPFMGSGTTGVAALRCQRQFIGIELDNGYCEKAKLRIEGDQLQNTA